MSKWQQFLNEVFEGDQVRIELLRGVMRSVIHDHGIKIFVLLQGPSRCGKGIIAKIIHELSGPLSVISPRIPSRNGKLPALPEGKKLMVVTGGFTPITHMSIKDNIPYSVVIASNSSTLTECDHITTILFNKSFNGMEQPELYTQLLSDIESIRSWVS